MTTRQRWATRSGEQRELLDYTQHRQVMTSESVRDTPGLLLGIPELQTRTILLDEQQRATAAADGTFEGYACVWDVVDSYGTTFKRGSFVEGGLDQGEYALLWMHDPTQVLGAFTAREDNHGLLISGGWDDTPEGQTARVRAKRSAPGLSVGFVPIGVDPDDENAFTSARLVETSQITLRMASVPGASITKARKADEAARQAKLDADVARARLMLLP
jgi:HK97 family phage prohead protease